MGQSLLQATSTFITEERIMMINGFLTLSVVMVCAVYLLGGVAGDADTVSQEWPGRRSCYSCDDCESAVEGVDQWNICEFVLEYDLEKMLVDALKYCPDNWRVKEDIEDLIEDAAVCEII